MNNLTVAGMAPIVERMETNWTGIVIPALTLTISIIAVWAVYTYFKKS